jgi:hypothetical protein
MDMAKKTVENRDVLRFKLGALNDHISHHERSLDQFRIDLDKTALFRALPGADDLVDRVMNIVSQLHKASPRKSVFEADLAVARAEVRAGKDALPEWAAVKAKAIRSGLAEVPIEEGFELVLSYAMTNVLERLNGLRASGALVEGGDGPAREWLATLKSFADLLDVALDPARHLRQRYLDALNGETGSTGLGVARHKKGGRPKDEGKAWRYQKMCEAWASNKKRYGTYAKLAEAFGCSKDTAGKEVRKRQQAIREQQREAPIRK